MGRAVYDEQAMLDNFISAKAFASFRQRPTKAIQHRPSFAQLAGLARGNRLRQPVHSRHL